MTKDLVKAAGNQWLLWFNIISLIVNKPSSTSFKYNENPNLVKEESIYTVLDNRFWDYMPQEILKL